MPAYRVGVSLNLRGNYGQGLTGAAAHTERFRGAVTRTAGSATGGLRRISAAAAGVGNAVGRTARRSVSGLQLISGAAAGVGGALNRAAGATRRVGTAARRMADTTIDALGRTRRRVNDLIGRFRALERTSRNAGGGLGGGIGRLAGAAGGIYGVSRVVSGEADFSQRLRNLTTRIPDFTEADHEDLNRRISDAAEKGMVTRASLLAAADREYTLSGEIGPILEDIPAIARVLRADPTTAPEDLGAYRALFKNFVGLDTPEGRERAMHQTLLATAKGSLSQAELARGAGEAVSAQTNAFGDRSFENFLLASQQTMTGYMKAEPALTAMTSLMTVLAVEREALTKQIGSVQPGGSLIDVADRIVASVGGEVSALKGTPFGSQEVVRALNALTGQTGRDLGTEIQSLISAPLEDLQRVTDLRWQRQADEPAAAIEVAQDIGQRDMGGPLMTLWRPATLALVTHLPKIELGVAALVAAYGVTKAASWVGRGVSWWRGRGRAPGAPEGGFGGTPSAVATMRVGTLIVGSMPGGAPGTRAAPGTILGSDGKPAPRGGGGAVPRGGGGAGRPGRLAGWGRALRAGGRGIPYAGAAVAGLTLLPAVASGDTRSVAQSTAGLAGGLAFAKMGAAIGTAIALGIGTAIGGLAGSVIGWFAGEQAGAALLNRDTWRPRVDVELDERGRPAQSVRGRVRQQERGLMARTSGVPEEVDVDVEGVEDEDLAADIKLDRPRRSVRGRVRQQELNSRAPELRPAAARSVTYNSDNSDRRTTVNNTITVQAADDPARTAEMVADEVERRQRRRDRRIRATVLEDPEPDPEF